MGIKRFRPTTSSQRYMSVSTFEEVTTNRPLKSLTKGKKRISGRGAGGRISIRRRGGGHKKRYRVIDFKRNKRDIEGKVASIEYDPNRTARIALIFYPDGEKRYIISPNGLSVGDKIIAGEKVKIKVGNSLPLSNIPVGTMVHNVELKPNKGGQLARSAGTSAEVSSKTGNYVALKMPSSEIRLVRKECYATVGQVGNIDHENIDIGKAGRKRWLGRRPKVRGVVMNPVDHPLGGGEGRSSGGRHPCSPTGVPTKGYKTRKRNKFSNKYILQRRKTKKKK